MLIRWLNHVIFGHRQETPNQSDSKKLTHGEPGLLDVIHEAIKEEATELADLVRAGLPSVRRRNRRERVRQKVKKAIDPSFEADGLVEEITDRINDAAEFDPYYQRLFQDSKHQPK